MAAVSALILIITLAGVLVRPRDMHESTWAALGVDPERAYGLLAGSTRGRTSRSRGRSRRSSGSPPRVRRAPG